MYQDIRKQKSKLKAKIEEMTEIVSTQKKELDKKEKELKEKSEEISQFQKDKTVFKTLERNYHYQNEIKNVTIDYKSNSEYNYKGELLNKRENVDVSVKPKTYKCINPDNDKYYVPMLYEDENGYLYAGHP